MVSRSVGVAVLLAAVAAALGAQDVYQARISRAQVKKVEAAKSDLAAANVDAAIGSLREVVAAEPGYYRAHYNLGLAQLEKGDTKSAIAELREALSIKERESLKDTTIYNSLGWAYLLARDYPDAERYLQEAAKHEPENTKATNTRVMNNLGVLYTYMGKYDEARKYLTKARDQYGSGQATLNLQLLDKVQKGAKRPGGER